MTLLSASCAGTRWEVRADSPIADATADRARSTGTPAAISAPKATSRITSVTGRLNTSARWKSLPTVAASPLWMDASPTSSMRSAGWSCCTAAVVSSSGCTRSADVSGSPAIVTDTMSVVPSGDGTGPSTVDTPDSARMRLTASSAAVFACVTSSVPERELTSTRSTDGCTGKCPDLIICSARLVSPALPLSVAFVVPTNPPMAIDATTNSVHSAIARHGWVALQRAIRTVSGLRSTSVVSSSRPVNACQG